MAIDYVAALIALPALLLIVVLLLSMHAYMLRRAIRGNIKSRFSIPDQQNKLVENGTAEEQTCAEPSIQVDVAP